MKILVIHSLSPDSFEVIADSAMSLQGRPVFLPDIPDAGSWKVRTMLALRISRLGKNVSVKFAPRYFDALSVAFRLLPYDTGGRFMTRVAPVIDFGLAVGRWREYQAADSPLKVSVGSSSVIFESPVAEFSKAIAAVSCYATIKMGDILLFPLTIPELPVAIGSHLQASLVDCQVTDIRLK